MRLNNFFPALFAVAIDTMSFSMLFPVMTVLFTMHGSPFAQALPSDAMRNFYLGLSFLLFPLFMAFGTPFLSDLSDQYGRRRILSICMFGSFISFIIMFFAIKSASIAFLLFGRALSGLVAGSQPIATAAIADMSTDAQKPRNMIFVSCAFCLGLVLGPLIGGELLDNPIFGYATPFYVCAFLSLIGFVWVLLGFRNIIEPRPSRIRFLRPLQILFEAIQDKKIRFLALGFLLMQIGYSLYFQYIIVHMRLLFHYDSVLLGRFSTMIGVGYFVGLIVAMPVAIRYFKSSSIAISSGLILGVLQILSVLVGVAFMQWPFALIIAIFDIMMFTAILTLFSLSVDSLRQGWVMGVANAMMGLAWVISGFASNLLSALHTSGLIALGGVILFFACFSLRAIKK